jgi:allantoinase
LEILRGAKREGLPITAETCPHYLGLAAEEIPDGATEFKCAPPIRERENQDRLWAALLEGTLDFVVTDHSPCIPALKRQDTGDFMAAWGGIASLQLGLRSVWTEAAKRGIPLEQVHGWMAVQTAQFLGRPGRGRLVVGAEANLVAFKPEPVSVLSHHSLLQRHPISPWVGKLLEGIVAGTWLRGKQIWDGSNICGMPQGRILLGREQ